MTYQERLQGRSSPAFFLPSCPNCLFLFDIRDYVSDDVEDDWTCFVCKERLDLWWDTDDIPCVIEDTISTELARFNFGGRSEKEIADSLDAFDEVGIMTPVNMRSSEKPNGYDRMQTLIGVDHLTAKHCICCDSLYCDRQELEGLGAPVDWLTISGKYIDEWLKSNEIRDDQIYEINDDLADCRACSRYRQYDCIPLRNWIRHYEETGDSPEVIIPCRNFDLDEEYMESTQLEWVTLAKHINTKGLVL